MSSNDHPTSWTFLTNHTQVLLRIAQDPDVRLETSPRSSESPSGQPKESSQTSSKRTSSTDAESDDATTTGSTEAQQCDTPPKPNTKSGHSSISSDQKPNPTPAERISLSSSARGATPERQWKTAGYAPTGKGGRDARRP